jgi:hypothetical protein
VRLPLALLAAAMLAGCSEHMPVAESRPPAEDAPDDCVEQFVQEFEVATPDVPPQDHGSACFDTTPPEGPPKFPSTSRKVRLEYDRGDYFVVQETVSWWLGDPDLARGCGTIPRLKRERVVERVQGGVKESLVTEDGETKRSADTGRQYGGRIHLGSGPGWMPTAVLVSPENLASEVLREETPYGTCLRATASLGTICSLEQGRNCRSYKTMLPIEIRVPNAAGGGTQVGKTTSLERITPNKSEWVLQ